MIFSGNYEQFCEQLIQHVFIVYFYTTWQIPSVSFLCNDSYSPRGPKQHRIIGSTRTALGRTAPHISSWIFHQTKGLISLSVICYQPVSMGTCYDLTILITNILRSIILLIRDFLILTINWQRSGWIVAVERSHSESQVLVLCGKGPIAVMTLIKHQRILAKLIETSTELLQSM